MRASYFPLATQVAKRALSSPISPAICGNTVSISVRSFDGVSSKKRSANFQNASFPPSSAAHSEAEIDATAMAAHEAIREAVG